jgi:G3E family GTPase
VAFADRLLLNKVDLVPEEADRQRIEARLRGINLYAPITRCTNGVVAGLAQPTHLPLPPVLSAH